MTFVSYLPHAALDLSISQQIKPHRGSLGATHFTSPGGEEKHLIIKSIWSHFPKAKKKLYFNLGSLSMAPAGP